MAPAPGVRVTCQAHPYQKNNADGDPASGHVKIVSRESETENDNRIAEEINGGHVFQCKWR